MQQQEFERVAARLADLEDYLQEMSRFYGEQTPGVRIVLNNALRLAISAHGQLQLELMHPELAMESDSTPTRESFG